jgi:hypothetical protein
LRKIDSSKSFLFFSVLGLILLLSCPVLINRSSGLTSYSVTLDSTQDNGASANLGLIILNGRVYTLSTSLYLYGNYQVQYVLSDPNYAFVQWWTYGNVRVSDWSSQTTILNVNGSGKLSAVYSFQPTICMFTVNAKDEENKPLQNITIKIDNNPFITDSQGRASLNVILGSHIVETQQERYSSPSNDVRDVFTRWTYGSTSGYDNPRTIYVSSSSEYTVYYAKQYLWRWTTAGLPSSANYIFVLQSNRYTLTTPAVWQQWVNLTVQYLFGTSFAITPWNVITWDEKTYMFDHWENGTGNIVSSTSTCSQIVSRPETFTAFYRSTPIYALNLTVNVQQGLFRSSPAPNASVKVTYYGIPVASGLTDANGNITFKLPPNPEYQIVATKGIRSKSTTTELFNDKALNLRWI